MGRTLLGKVLSDDLIRVWVDNVRLRALVFVFLRSSGGQDQLLRKEYGTVQQHLEPTHVADVQLPLPDDPEKLNELLGTVGTALKAHERSLEMGMRADAQMLNLLQWRADNAESPEKLFKKLAAKWRKETGMLSVIQQK